MSEVDSSFPNFHTETVDELYQHLNVAAQTDVGQRRKRNEDSLTYFPERGIFGVADGMGGESDGAFASQTVSQVLDEMTASLGPLGLEASQAERKQRVHEAVEAANERIRAHMALRVGRSGSTLALLLLDPRNPENGNTIHAGDSRVYRIRAGTIEQMTRDHTIFEEARMANLQVSKPEGEKLTRAIGIFENIVAETTKIDLQLGDLFLICSDGLYRMISPARMLEIIEEHGTAEVDAILEQMIREANEAGGKDNISVVLVFVRQIPAVSRPSGIPVAQWADDEDVFMPTVMNSMTGHSTPQDSEDASEGDSQYASYSEDESTDHTPVMSAIPRTLDPEPRKRFPFLLIGGILFLLAAGLVAWLVLKDGATAANNAAQDARIDTARVEALAELQLDVDNRFWLDASKGLSSYLALEGASDAEVDGLQAVIGKGLQEKILKSVSEERWQVAEKELAAWTAPLGERPQPLLDAEPMILAGLKDLQDQRDLVEACKLTESLLAKGAIEKAEQEWRGVEVMPGTIPDGYANLGMRIQLQVQSDQVAALVKAGKWSAADELLKGLDPAASEALPALGDLNNQVQAGLRFAEADGFAKSNKFTQADAAFGEAASLVASLTPGQESLKQRIQTGLETAKRTAALEKQLADADAALAAEDFTAAQSLLDAFLTANKGPSTRSTKLQNAISAGRDMNLRATSNAKALTVVRGLVDASKWSEAKAGLTAYKPIPGQDDSDFDALSAKVESGVAAMDLERRVTAALATGDIATAQQALTSFPGKTDAQRALVAKLTEQMTTMSKQAEARVKAMEIKTLIDGGDFSKAEAALLAYGSLPGHQPDVKTHYRKILDRKLSLQRFDAAVKAERAEDAVKALEVFTKAEGNDPELSEMQQRLTSLKDELMARSDAAAAIGSAQKDLRIKADALQWPSDAVKSGFLLAASNDVVRLKGGFLPDEQFKALRQSACLEASKTAEAQLRQSLPYIKEFLPGGPLSISAWWPFTEDGGKVLQVKNSDLQYHSSNAVQLVAHLEGPYERPDYRNVVEDLDGAEALLSAHAAIRSSINISKRIQKLFHAPSKTSAELTALASKTPPPGIHAGALSALMALEKSLKTNPNQPYLASNVFPIVGDAVQALYGWGRAVHEAIPDRNQDAKIRLGHQLKSWADMLQLDASGADGRYVFLPFDLLSKTYRAKQLRAFSEGSDAVEGLAAALLNAIMANPDLDLSK